MAARTFIALFIFGAFCAFVSAAESPATKGDAPVWAVQWQPQTVVNGSPILFQVKARNHLKSLEGTWLGHPISFAQDVKSQTWFGLGAVNLDTKPGVYTLVLNGTTTSDQQISFRKTIAVRKGKYREIALTVPKRFTEPNPEEQQKIAADRAVKQQFLGRVTPDREWEGDFTPPVNTATSDVFGTRRIINGKVQSVHQGLDYAAREGTPVDAVNRGTVLLARPLYFEGNFVVLDHGQGLLTLYLHLSRIDVKEGDKIERGQQIGLSGGTGRATGPHLHIAVRWNGVYVDPGTLFTLKIPTIP